ncbi:DNA repair protein [Hortaea werneckii]|nr:DNA repair protein [Hortaea werneckii]
MGSRLEQKSNLVRKRIESHTFSNEEGDEYEGSKFGGFPEYFRRKKIKLQNLDAEIRANSGDKPQIFKGIVCHVNGYTQPSLNDLHNMIVQHGGGFVQYLDEFRKYRIVKPAWIVNSVNAGKLQPWDDYRVVDEGVGQKVLGFQSGQMVSQANRKAESYKEQTDTSWYTSQLKGQSAQLPGSVKDPRITQTVTPDDDIEDDEYPLPEITSSIERAMEEDDGLEPTPTTPPKTEQPRNLLEVRTELGTRTPPPSSPVEAESKDDATGYVEETAAFNPNGVPLRPREGSQEPDYSMAVVRDSEALRSVSPARLAQMTAEEHNALLLSDPKIRKSTVVNPDFLEQYYRESRLHHLSTWKADLKSQLQALAAEKTSSQKSKLKKLPGQRRYIMHVDFDSFFAAVSLKKNPQHRDKPCVVAHGQGSGSEIASCNYKAREYGVSNGMWMRRALDLCPELKILPYDFPGYEMASRKFYDAIMATGGVVQSVSIDEALVDISAICFAESGTDGVKRYEGAVNREQRKADLLAQQLRDEVFEKTGCAVSVGIGNNILLAKIALRKAKPAGQYQLKPEDMLDFIGALEVTKLPGVAWSIGGKLEEIGVRFVRDIRELTKEKLVNTLGPKTGEKIWDYSRGIDKTEVGDQVIRKSISAEVNWGVRFENQEQVEEFMQGLCGELHKRLIKERVKGRQLTMKVMKRAADAPLDPPKHLGHGKCDTYNKSIQLGVATNDTAVIAKEAMAMMKAFVISPGELRGIGVQMQKLDPIKPSGEKADLGSQKRLQFKIGEPSKPATFDNRPAKPAEDPILDDVKTPEKQRVADFDSPNAPAQQIGLETPVKKQLNVLGTQFVFPTQVDPNVLSELPEDIKAKLARHAGPVAQPVVSAAQPKNDQSKPSSRAQSPAVALPTESQLDPNILEALPDDVRAEVLGFYRSPGNRKRGEQQLLPQSPRKNRTLPPTKQPVKRKRGGGLFAGRLRNNLRSGDNPTLTQANFVARPNARQLQDDSGAATTDTEGEGDQLDPEFLAALPEDVRQEVLDQQRNARLQRTGGIDLSLHRQRSRARKKKAQEEEGPSERLLQLPPRPSKPSFTSRKLSELPDLRQAVKAWYKEFSDEGPYDEDIGALANYLKLVVLEERDMGKAVAVAKWMAWVVEEGEETVSDEVNEAWMDALGRIRMEIQDAMNERGLGAIDFG